MRIAKNRGFPAEHDLRCTAIRFGTTAGKFVNIQWGVERRATYHSGFASIHGALRFASRNLSGFAKSNTGLPCQFWAQVSFRLCVLSEVTVLWCTNFKRCEPRRASSSPTRSQEYSGKLSFAFKVSRSATQNKDAVLWAGQ